MHVCRHGEEDKRERALQGRKVVGSLGHMTRGREVSMEVKEVLQDTIIVLIVIYATETWMWNKCQRSKIQTVEMNYLKDGCGVNKIDGKSDENVCGRFAMSSGE